jgi:hypothetical protein
MRSNQTKKIALGGMLAAVALVVMCFGGFIPIATYVCPMLCAMTQFVVLRFCGKRIAWTWFCVVSVLSLLLGPDKEAVMVFLAIGYYPLIKDSIEKTKFRILWKFVLFNSAIMVIYSIMIHLLGMQELAQENMELGLFGLAVILLMGNIAFFLLDRLLGIMERKLR